MAGSPNTVKGLFVVAVAAETGEEPMDIGQTPGSVVERHGVLEHGARLEMGLDTPSVRQEDLHEAVYL